MPSTQWAAATVLLLSLVLANGSRPSQKDSKEDATTGGRLMANKTNITDRPAHTSEVKGKSEDPWPYTIWQALPEAGNQLEQNLDILVNQYTKLDQQLNFDKRARELLDDRIKENEEQENRIRTQIKRLKVGRKEAMDNLDKTLMEFPQKALVFADGNLSFLEEMLPTGKKKNSVNFLETFFATDIKNNSKSFLEEGVTQEHVDPKYESLKEAGRQIEAQYDWIFDQKQRLIQTIASDKTNLKEAETRLKENRLELGAIEAQLKVLNEGKSESAKKMKETIKNAAIAQSKDTE